MRHEGDIGEVKCKKGGAYAVYEHEKALSYVWQKGVKIRDVQESKTAL